MNHDLDLTKDDLNLSPGVNIGRNGSLRRFIWFLILLHTFSDIYLIFSGILSCTEPD